MLYLGQECPGLIIAGYQFFYQLRKPKLHYERS